MKSLVHTEELAPWGTTREKNPSQDNLCLAARANMEQQKIFFSIVTHSYTQAKHLRLCRRIDFSVDESTCREAIFQGGGGGERRALGSRNDVLTTCKAVNPRASQRPSKAAMSFVMISTLAYPGPRGFS